MQIHSVLWAQSLTIYVKFSRDVIFEVDVIFKVSQSTDYPQNFYPWNFMDKTLACINRRAVILKNKIAKMLDLWHPENLHASKICTYTVYVNQLWGEGYCLTEVIILSFQSCAWGGITWKTINSIYVHS